MQNLKHKQEGVALFVSLIFLLILTVLGVTSMNDTIMQGKMASAIQDGNVALQGAETAVRLAEQDIESFASVGDFNNSAHLYTEGSGPDPFLAATWVGDSSEPTVAVTGQASAPRYFIELAGEVTTDDSELALNIDTYSHESGGGTILAFRIIARGTGGTSKAQRIIETFYAKRF
jgi:type IV pilus assembly protein PilX